MGDPNGAMALLVFFHAVLTWKLIAVKTWLRERFALGAVFPQPACVQPTLEVGRTRVDLPKSSQHVVRVHDTDHRHNNSRGEHGTSEHYPPTNFCGDSYCASWRLVPHVPTRSPLTNHRRHYRAGQQRSRYKHS